MTSSHPHSIGASLFEIIAKAPIAQHLKKRVVISVQADVFQVVVFAAGTDALLRVRRARGLAGDGAGPFINVGGARSLRKMGTNWFMPAFVNSSPGESGIKLEEGTMVCPFGFEEIQKRIVEFQPMSLPRRLRIKGKSSKFFRRPGHEAVDEKIIKQPQHGHRAENPEGDAMHVALEERGVVARGDTDPN